MTMDDAINKAIAGWTPERIAGMARLAKQQNDRLEKRKPLESLKLAMQHSAWDGVIELSDALKNIDDFAKEQHMNNYEQATQEVRDAFNALCKGRVEAAVKAEREACAQLVDDNADDCNGPMGLVLRANAEAIRARGDGA